ncbi:Maf family protein [Bacillus coahuilensis]|uniref:Maf family protein n=1 Tax=Bacillus coahuilensis TaxID=408580 RepID=UPI0001851174|nr:Maf family protein [Bacillus coahuilensis]
MKDYLILASSSPRRKMLLEQVGLLFDVKTSDVDEKIDKSWTASETVLQLSYEKAKAVFQLHPEAIVIGADTVVTLDGEILGKPKDHAEAVRMLSSLSGRTHQVLTGVSILSPGKEERFYEQTDVTFYPLTDMDITQYIESGEPWDKAGAYGIQGLGSILVKGIVGDYFNVVGLPLASVYRKVVSY